MSSPARFLISTIARRVQPGGPAKFLSVINNNNNKILTRNAGFHGSREVRPIEEYPDVEVVQNPAEWKYVEQVLPPKIIPKPEKRDSYASGWKWPSASEKDPSELKYFVARTKNHMVPVYLETRFRGKRRITVVRRIQGDIWALEKDLRAVVEKERGKLCASRVNEMSQQISFHGDYEDVIREYLKSKGF